MNAQQSLTPLTVCVFYMCVAYVAQWCIIVQWYERLGYLYHSVGTYLCTSDMTVRVC